MLAVRDSFELGLYQTGPYWMRSSLGMLQRDFPEGTGNTQGHQLVVPENTAARFYKPRPVPYAIRGAIEKDLEQLELGGNQEDKL
jgi:hypothetical protein